MLLLLVVVLLLVPLLFLLRLPVVLLPLLLALLLWVLLRPAVGCWRGMPLSFHYDVTTCKQAVDRLFQNRHLCGRRNLNAVCSGCWSMKCLTSLALYQRTLDALARALNEARHRRKGGCDACVGVAVCGGRAT